MPADFPHRTIAPSRQKIVVEDTADFAGVFRGGVALDMLAQERSATLPKVTALAASSAAAFAALSSSSRFSSTGFCPVRARVIDSRAMARASATFGVWAIVPNVSIIRRPYVAENTDAGGG
jgi:hypothetical protein